MSIKATQRKLTDEQVYQIRREYIHGKGAEATKKLIELAQRYGVSQQSIRAVAKGKRYEWVE